MKILLIQNGKPDHAVEAHGDNATQVVVNFFLNYEALLGPVRSLPALADVLHTLGTLLTDVPPNTKRLSTDLRNEAGEQQFYLAVELDYQPPEEALGATPPSTS